jgi:ATP-dependent Clp protease adaptor protein ClpS
MEEQKTVDEVMEDIFKKRQIFVFNDEVNSFEHVIECFIKILGHSPEQSEQLAMIIHNNGKASVKNGDEATLHPLCKKLKKEGLSAEID